MAKAIGKVPVIIRGYKGQLPIHSAQVTNISKIETITGANMGNSGHQLSMVEIEGEKFSAVFMRPKEGLTLIINHGGRQHDDAPQFTSTVIGDVLDLDFVEG